MGCGVVKEAEDNLRPLPSGRARTEKKNLKINARINRESKDILENIKLIDE